MYISEFWVLSSIKIYTDICPPQLILLFWFIDDIAEIDKKLTSCGAKEAETLMKDKENKEKFRDTRATAIYNKRIVSEILLHMK